MSRGECLVEARDYPAIENLRYAVLSSARSDQLPQVDRSTLVLTACAGLRYRSSRSNQGSTWEGRVTRSVRLIEERRKAIRDYGRRGEK